MNRKLGLLAVVLGAATLALAGVLRDVNTSKALVLLPVQPFAADELGGISTNQLGQSIAANYTVTQVLQGERTTIPGVFSGPGFSVDLDASIPDTTPVGTVWSNVDANCDGVVDYMADDCDYPGPPGPYTPWLSPLTWLEATTDVDSTGEGFLKTIMPNPAIFPWLLRHKVDITHLCYGTSGAELAAVSVLNTVYAGIPSSPGGNTFVAATKLGGSPTTPPSIVCLDSPQSSVSITTVYNNPPLKGNTGGPTGAGGRALDDGSGLYARWTILQSTGSTSLPRSGDLRKVYQSPPSFPSDTGYVERYIDLQCFWIDDNGCDASHGACDANDDGAISEVESWQDPDLLALGGIDAVDHDRDCLMASGKTQPGWPAPVDTQDEPSGFTCDADPRWVVYSENSVLVHHDTHADTDCDGLVDGIEYAYGSDPLLADSDGDGAPDFVEMFQFTDPTDPDTDDDGFKDAPAPTYQNSNPAYDNCPSVANPANPSQPQLNSDGKGRPNGLIPNDASNPNKDKLGDDCDPDNDNDGATDAYEIAQGTNRLLLDTDSDGVNDGAEWRLFTDPNDDTDKPSWSNIQQVYYRGCQINVPLTGPFAGSNPGSGVERDPDGDGINCPVDTDSDNGTGSGIAAPIEILDSIEAFGYNTSISNKDTDGDTCEDWIEIVDLNGNRAADLLDVGLVVTSLPPASDNVRDIDKDGVPGTDADKKLAMYNSFPTKTDAYCGPTPTPRAGDDFHVRLDPVKDGDDWCDPIDDIGPAPVRGDFQVGVCVENPPAAIAAFQAEVTYDGSLSVAPEISCPSGDCLDDNPDANAGTTKWGDGLGSGWVCNIMDLSEPTGDAGPPTGPGQKRARIVCWSLDGPYTLGDNESAGALAVLTLQATAPGTQELELRNVIVGDAAGVEIGSCNPALGVNVSCDGATVLIQSPVGGIAEPPNAAAAGGSSSPPYAALAGAAAIVVVAAGGWYARRRRRAG